MLKALNNLIEEGYFEYGNFEACYFDKNRR
jgi:hypothetical protein